jgi:hypothetical protein
MQGEILLVYLNDGKVNAAAMRDDQLSGKDRHLIRTTAEDPLSMLKRMKVRKKAS